MIISTSVLVLMEMQIKTTKRYHSTSNGLSKIEKASLYVGSSGRCGITGILLH